MSRIPTSILLGLGIAVLLQACDAPRKACRKAERLVAKAVWKCPEILALDTARDTVVITIPGDTLNGEIHYAQAEIDKILQQCDSLAKAAQDGDTVVITNTVTKLRREACRIEPVHIDTAGLVMDIREVDGLLTYSIERLAHNVMVPVAVPCPPRAQPGTGNYTGVAAWYASGFWVLLVLCVVLVASHYMKRKT